jgi:hypothetical protein
MRETVKTRKLMVSFSVAKEMSPVMPRAVVLAARQ